MAQLLPLLNFPEELLLFILSQLSDDLATLSALACACKRLQDLAESFLYAAILITKGSQLQRLTHALNAREGRVRLVNALDLRCRVSQTEGMSLTKTLLPDLAHLKALAIESPWCNHSSASPAAWNDEVESYAQIFRDASLLVSSPHRGPHQPLARLKSCQ